MSIQTELTRITNAKAAIKTAIEGKGVTVPDGTLLDGMAALIDSIEAGGGYEVIAGTFTPGSDNYMYEITNSGDLTTTTGNNLVKYGILLSEQADTDISTSNNYCSIVTFGDIQKSVLVRGYNSSYTKSTISTGYGIYIGKGKLYAGEYYGSGKFRAGITYRYAVVL